MLMQSILTVSTTLIAGMSSTILAAPLHANHVVAREANANQDGVGSSNTLKARQWGDACAKTFGGCFDATYSMDIATARMTREQCRQDFETCRANNPVPPTDTEQ